MPVQLFTTSWSLRPRTRSRPPRILSGGGRHAITLTGPIVTVQKQRDQDCPVSDTRVPGFESEAGRQDESAMPELLVPSRVQGPVQGGLRQEPPATAPRVAALRGLAPRGAGAFSRGSGPQAQAFWGVRPTRPGHPTVAAPFRGSRASPARPSTSGGRGRLLFFQEVIHIPVRCLPSSVFHGMMPFGRHVRGADARTAAPRPVRVTRPSSLPGSFVRSQSHLVLAPGLRCSSGPFLRT